MEKSASIAFTNKQRIELVIDMGGQPFYHLRPNKNIDRSLFLQTLIGLNRVFQMSEYQYIGFGSFLFDDFKAIHDTLNIREMISLEIDPIEYKRAEYNLPYKCISVQNMSSTDYLAGLLLKDTDHSIFWLDFVSPKELGLQLADFTSLLEKLNPGDIIRITLNAKPDCLELIKGDRQDNAQRLATLRSRVREEYLPPVLSEDHVSTKMYPLTLLEILKTAAMRALVDDPPDRANFLFPLFSCVYADGQQMLTFTGIVLDSHDMEEEIRTALTHFPHNTFLWDNPCHIEIPALTVREITELNKLLPNPDVREEILHEFPFIFNRSDPNVLNSYVSYYKYYPKFHQINL